MSMINDLKNSEKGPTSTSTSTLCHVFIPSKWSEEANIEYTALKIFRSLTDKFKGQVINLI